MANKPLEYKGHPLQRAGNIVYYGSMSDKYVIMLQIMDTKKVKDLDVATKVSVQLQLTDPMYYMHFSAQHFINGHHNTELAGFICYASLNIQRIWLTHRAVCR